ncbi:MAG: PQQ-binding-like beta-propeller repeat protein, partial [bacterium]|nr:PQQ-binding-like beta-propeller repeat protein [bacterium]
GHGKGYLHQPDKAFKLNDHEVLINDGNNRRVIIVDQRTNDIVWQYGKTLTMGTGPGLLRGNTHAVPLDGGKQILITDTLEKKLILVDHTTKNVLWEWEKPDAKWLQHVFPTAEGTFVLEDRQKNEVFELNRQGEILWTLNELADGSRLRYPTDTVKLGNGNVLIAEAGQQRIIEVNPQTKQIVWQYGGGKPTPGASAGLPTTLAIDHRAP